jgi:hypothetical protein
MGYIPIAEARMNRVGVILSSASMGDVDELDFALWARYVREHLGEATGLDVTVEQGRFGDAGEDLILGGTYADKFAARCWLNVDGWNAFCSGPWTRARAAAA